MENNSLQAEWFKTKNAVEILENYKDHYKEILEKDSISHTCTQESIWQSTSQKPLQLTQQDKIAFHKWGYMSSLKL